MITIPSTQAIKFLPEGEANFNNSDICGCNTDEKWNYKVTAGDDICFQLDATCEESADLVLNGSFEEAGELSTDFADWTINNDTEDTIVRRQANNSAPCGDYIAEWINNVDTPNVASITQSITLEANKTYKFLVKLKIEEGASPTNSNANAVIVTINSQQYFITPTTTWTEYEILATMGTSIASNTLVIELNSGLALNTYKLFVDCVSMIKYGECCVVGTVNNGCFELGANADSETELPATFDNWTTSGVSESLTGGINGTRCITLNGLGSNAEQINVFTPNTNYTISFWAKANIAGTSLQVYAYSSVTLILSQTLTTEWVLYTVNFQNVSDTTIQFTQDETENIIFLDCVQINSLPEVNVVIYDTVNDIEIPVSNDAIQAYDSAINVCFNVDDYETPDCFIICVTSCITNLILNGNFKLGSSNTFTNWTLIQQANRINEIIYSQQFQQTSAWTNTNLNINLNSLAPDGTMTADTLNANNINAVHSVSQFVTYGTSDTHTFSVYAKDSGYGTLLIHDSESDTGCFFDLSTGTVGSDYGTTPPINKYIVPFDNGYYRCCMVYFNNSDSNINLYVCQDESTIAFIGTLGGITVFQAQLENNTSATPNILTTTATVTTSVGEIIQTTTGGIDGGRAAQIWGAYNTVRLRQSITLTNGVEYNVKAWVRYEDLDSNPNIQFLLADNNIGYYPLTSSYELIEFNFTNSGTGSKRFEVTLNTDNKSGFATIDNIIVTPSALVSTYCSESFGYYEELDSCSKELIWYDNEDFAQGINYASGFKNRMRINAARQNPSYLRSDFSKSLNGDVSFINSIKFRKTWDFSIEASPEFIWDRMASMAGISNIEYDGIEMCSAEETELNPSWDKNSRLAAGTITLLPKGEYIVNRSYNCP
jgi:hypothetical protein